MNASMTTRRHSISLVWNHSVRQRAWCYRSYSRGIFSPDQIKKCPSFFRFFERREGSRSKRKWSTIPYGPYETTARSTNRICHISLSVCFHEEYHNFCMYQVACGKRACMWELLSELHVHYCAMPAGSGGHQLVIYQLVSKQGWSHEIDWFK